MVRLLLVEDHAAFRDALAYLLGLEPWLEVVDRCGSLAECRALGDLLGDVDVLDLALPARLGAAALLLGLPFAGSPLSPLAFIALVVAVLLALTAFETLRPSP